MMSKAGLEEAVLRTSIFLSSIANDSKYLKRKTASSSYTHSTNVTHIYIISIGRAVRQKLQFEEGKI